MPLIFTGYNRDTNKTIIDSILVSWLSASNMVSVLLLHALHSQNSRTLDTLDSFIQEAMAAVLPNLGFRNQEH